MPKPGIVKLSIPILAALLCGLAGCESGSNASADSDRTPPETRETGSAGQNPPGHSPESAGGHGLKPGPLLDGWPPPAVAILLSGEMEGYIEPCGCTERQSGGLSRRADLVRQIRERGWPLTAFDLGNTVHRNRRQSQIKFATILDIFKEMPYEGLAVGPKELRLNPDFLISQIPNSRFPECELPYLAANVTFTGGLEDFSPARSRVVTIDGTTIGVTAVLGKSMSGEIVTQGSNLAERFSVTEPAQELPGVLETLKQQSPDVLLLLSHAEMDESRALAREFPEFDVVLSAGGPEDPGGKPERIGDSLLLTAGRKGKYAGVLGFYPDKEQRFRYELVNLDVDRFDDSPKVIAHLKEYQEQLRSEQIAAAESPLTHPSGATFVGAEKCGQCHTKAYEKWSSTLHAHAFESLKPDTPRAKERLKGILRTHDPECLACHVTGWAPQQVLRYESGFINEEFAETEAERTQAKRLKGNQCENCHGPGSRHVELIEASYLQGEAKAERTREKASEEVRVTLQEARNGMCMKCHDLDNSPNFDFETYWPEIAHPWIE